MALWSLLNSNLKRKRGLRGFLGWWLRADGPSQPRSSSLWNVLASVVFLGGVAFLFAILGAHGSGAAATPHAHSLSSQVGGYVVIGWLGLFFMFLGQKRFEPDPGAGRGRWLGGRWFGPLLVLVSLGGLVSLAITSH